MDLPDWNPHIYAGYVDTVQPNKWHTSDIQGPMFQAETSPEGLGLVGRYQPGAGLFGIGAQYGMKIPGTPITITPSAGMAYVDKQMPELPLQAPFMLGLQAGVDIPYTKARLIAEYLHMSNAGRKEPNIGMDTGSIMLGYPF